LGWLVLFEQRCQTHVVQQYSRNAEAPEFIPERNRGTRKAEPMCKGPHNKFDLKRIAAGRVEKGNLALNLPPSASAWSVRQTRRRSLDFREYVVA